MTRRIAMAILVSVWALLVAAGFAFYVTTRSVLLTGLDASLVSRAMSLPGLSRPAGQDAASTHLSGDRWIIKDEVGRTLDRPARGPASGEPSPLIDARFSRSPEGILLRTVTVRVFKVASDGRGSTVNASIIYSGSAEEFERLLHRLAWSLGGVGLAAGLLAAAVAVRVSHVALRPLRATADQIETIDEQNLGQRIITDRLPRELVRMANKLNDLLNRLQQAFELRRRFLADASHELRTPVAALVTTIEVSLARPRAADSYHRTLESCLGDATLLKRLVERLMDQVRSETLNHDEPSTPENVSQLLEQCVKIVEPLATAKGLRLVREFPGELICEICKERLRSVVMNLLSNAIEYNRPDGQVGLRMSCNGSGLRLTFSDTGIGINSADLPHVFEPFFRADASRKHDAGHLGLGLSLVQANIRAMGGKCDVQSELGVGTTFEILFPGIHALAESK